MELIQQSLWLVRHLDEQLNTLAAWNLPGFYIVLFLIIFAETGLVVTPFLPGDSLLFALGALAASAATPLSLPLLLVLLIVAAVLGDAVNYAIGYRLGPKVFKYESSWLLNKKHLLKAQEFYEKYGSKTIILARFVPIVRTFAPFVAGIGKMNYSRFGFFNVLGGVAWVTICILAATFSAASPGSRSISRRSCWPSSSCRCCRWSSSSCWSGGGEPPTAPRQPFRAEPGEAA